MLPATWQTLNKYTIMVTMTLYSWCIGYHLAHSGYSVHSGRDYKAWGEILDVTTCGDICFWGHDSKPQKLWKPLKYSQWWNSVFQHKEHLPVVMSPWHISRVKCFKSAKGVLFRVILRTKCLFQKEKLFFESKTLDC